MRQFAIVNCIGLPQTSERVAQLFHCLRGTAISAAVAGRVGTCASKQHSRC